MSINAPHPVFAYIFLPRDRPQTLAVVLDDDAQIKEKRMNPVKTDAT